ncbi:MAG: Xaa-Pro peptidase family protein [Anaerolineales bacterium]|nr:Xaa-Pro peptidase family protein [Anaerolineales bacterium]
MTSPRLEKLNASLRAANLDAAILNPGATLKYLCGVDFHLMERPVVLFVAPEREPILVLPELETLKLDLIPFKTQGVAYGENPDEWNAAFAQAVQTLNLDGKRIGVEPQQLRLLEFRRAQAAAPNADFPDAEEVFADLRLRKDGTEIASMRRAVKIAQDALEATLPLIKIGMTEKELSAELVLQLLRHGSDAEFPFAPIVSAGPNSANPHALPSERKLQNGDLLVIDWGATYDGYISDLTRTFEVGAADEECRKIHEVVQAANAAGRAAAQPGVPCADVDKAARSVIEKAGYGKYFTHRTGHGIGMAAHEAPYMRGDNVQILEAGMTFTVEPGIYLAGRNGVRIEDNMLVTENGAESLSDLPREIRSVG